MTDELFLNLLQSEEALHRAFNLFDADHSGGIDLDEFTVMLQKLGTCTLHFDSGRIPSPGDLSFASHPYARNGGAPFLVFVSSAECRSLPDGMPKHNLHRHDP